MLSRKRTALAIAIAIAVAIAAALSVSSETAPTPFVPTRMPRRLSAPALGGVECLAQGRAGRVLSNGGDACVLVAVAVARSSRRFESMLETIWELCTAHSWVRVALNLFDVGSCHGSSCQEAGSSEEHWAGKYALHSCVTVSTIAAFKTRFWQQILTPSTVLATHLFLVDSDMDIRPSAFDLRTLVRLSEAVNISILSPAPYGEGNGYYKLDAPWLSGNYLLTKEYCGAQVSQWSHSCAVCRQAMVEVKSPLLTAAAWRVIHEHVLAHMPIEALTTPEHIDLMWCNLVGHHLDGCDPAKQKGLPAGSTNCIGRTSCAYSYVTPLRHLDDDEIGRRNVSTRQAGRQNAAETWLDQNAQKKQYSLSPSWRPKGTYLRSAPCWNTSVLAEALMGWDASAARVPQVQPPNAKRKSAPNSMSNKPFNRKLKLPVAVRPRASSGRAASATYGHR